MFKDFLQARSPMCKGLFLFCLLAISASGNVGAQTEEETPVPQRADTGTDGSGTVVIPLRATAMTQPVENLSVSPAALDLSLVDIGTAGTATFTLAHTGASDSDPVTIGAAELFGLNRGEFVVDFGGNVELYPGQDILVTVQLLPQIPGKKSAGIRIPIEGATAPVLVLLDGYARYPLTSDLFASVEDFDFGELLLGDSVTKQFTLNNSGESTAPAIDITGITATGLQGDAYSVEFAPRTLAPGESLDVTVTLAATTTGSKPAELQIDHTGANLAIQIPLSGTVVAPQAVPVSFGNSTLNNSSIQRGTSVQFGPDGKLYVSEVYGKIHVLDVARNGKNSYSVSASTLIELIYNVQNHDDEGNPVGLKGRELTGIRVVGSATAPEIFAVSSDPRFGAGPSGNDKGLDTNSGILHRLYKVNGQWVKQDLVRGLPRSEENHAGNGLLFRDGKLLISMGGHTNEGNRSNNFARLPEYALSSAIIEVDVDAIGNGTYDLPTLDDETRPGVEDENDPFGGNNGKNQAKLEANGPVKIYASGLRNAYDLVLTQKGNLYTFDNGPNSGWGGAPPGNCLDTQEDNGGATRPDSLHLVTRGYYGGHPNPTRGNKANTFNESNPQSPIEVAADPRECDFKAPGNANGALLTIGNSTNGMAEYTANNFGGAMKGDLLAAGFNKTIHRIELNDAGSKVEARTDLIKTAAVNLLDVTAQGSGDVFPGTIWAVGNGGQQPVYVFEPADY